MEYLRNLFSTYSVAEESTYKIIHDEILKNIQNEGELDLSNASEDQIEAEIFHRFHLRMFRECSDKLVAFKKENGNLAMFKENKAIILEMGAFMRIGTSRFSLDSKY